MKMGKEEMLRGFLNEGKGYIEQGDAVQASEKLYKVAEESIKALSQTCTRDIYEEAIKKGRWTTDLLFKAAEEMGREIRRYWDSAWTLHVQGFHEMKLNINSVRRRIEDIEELVNLVENEVKGNEA
jgi:hypothetical protein